jgi:hypothetical protein
MLRCWSREKLGLCIDFVFGILGVEKPGQTGRHEASETALGNVWQPTRIRALILFFSFFSFAFAPFSTTVFVATGRLCRRDDAHD